ncbi:hypothetical protein C2S53_005283 [Perilla frutescens var. hirtella]|uniref:Uncharacterized protein n=1 Tax=Perilla frutescens var. hirtella TaxID=608512 RepID=A0AAD4P5Z0_PERFH|nr:hypothetical protein C2S53_005283 [Perilla frutescens var. hirtella]
MRLPAKDQYFRRIYDSAIFVPGKRCVSLRFLKIYEIFSHNFLDIAWNLNKCTESASS